MSFKMTFFLLRISSSSFELFYFGNRTIWIGRIQNIQVRNVIYVHILTSAGCRMCVVLGGIAYRIISLSSQNLLRGMDMCDLCPSTKNRTGFFKFFFVSQSLNPLDIFEKCIRTHPLSLRFPQNPIRWHAVDDCFRWSFIWEHH